MCCKVSDPRISNLVVFFRVSDNRTGLEKLKLAELLARVRRSSSSSSPSSSSCWLSRGKRRNFECIRLGGFSYTVFPASGCVVATGISAHHLVESALNVFRESSGLAEEELLPHQVVNSTYSGRVECDGEREGRRVSVGQAVDSVFGLGGGGGYEGGVVGSSGFGAVGEYDPDRRWYVSFRTQFFPGICLRRRETCGGGTVNLFNNGRYVLVGVRSQRQAEELAGELCALMKRCWTTLGGVTSCAWPAGS